MATTPMSSAVPEFRSVEFGDGDVKAGAQPVFQAAYHLPPIFERLRSFDVEFEGKEGDHAGTRA